jgi:hypothetical protein
METNVIASFDHQSGWQRRTLTETNDPTASLELFAEELSVQHDHALPPGICCISTASCLGACVACLGTASTGC